MKRLPINRDRVVELFNYDPVVGVFTRKICTINRLRVGEVVGSLDGAGYLTTFFDGHSYKLHRLAWVIERGRIPDNLEVDHINGVRSDNRLVNLRLATRSQNAQNQKRAHRDATTGKRGVTLHKRTGRYAAQIFINGTNKHLGLFGSPDEAEAARIAAEKLLHPFSPINTEIIGRIVGDPLALKTYI